MPDCHIPGPNARLPFATAPYRPGPSASLDPCVLPSTCIVGDARDGPCRIARDHRRDRKTGPEFPILVLRCYTHGRSFTLYPLGHVPYGRTAVAPVSPDGELLTSRGESQPSRLAWTSTVVAPAFESVDRPIKRPPVADSPSWHFTEPADRLPPAAAVLGLGLPLPERVAEALAREIDLPRLTLLDATRRYGRARGPAQRAGVLRGVFEQLRPDRCLLDRLLAAGALAGRWGTALHWDVGLDGARCRRIPGRGTAAP